MSEQRYNGTIVSGRKDGKLANSDNIFDKDRRKMQSDINKEMKTRTDKSFDSLKQTKQSAEDGGENVITLTRHDGTSEQVKFYNGSKGSKGDKGEVGMQGNSGVADASNKTLVNDAITGGETDFLSAEVGKLGILTYDCSKGGSVTHATLQDAINSVPTTFQKVGLTITYKSGNTIYRYTLNANVWSSDPANWFSVEDKLNDLSSNIGKKADKEIVNTALDKKADKEIVNTALDKKADAEQVNNSLYDLEKKIGDRFVVEGDVTNLPDEEDLTSAKESERNVLKFADKRYAPENFSGKGYKRLRKNIQKTNLAVTKITVNSAPTKDGEISVTINNINTNISLVKNTHNTPALVAKAISDTLISAHTDYDIEVTNNIITLTRKYGGEVASSTFNVADTGVTITIEDSVKSVNRNILTADMISNPNTIYEIRYDFDFENESIILPKDSILCFKGGSFSNATLEGDNTTIQAQNYEIFKNVQIRGTWDTSDFYVEWFGAKGDGVSDDTTSIQKALDVVLSVTLPFHITVHLSKTYRITDTLNIHAETTLKGNFIGSYMNYAKTQYKCIVADFSDTKKWIVQSSNLKNSAYNADLGKIPVDSGTIKYQEAIRIEDIKIESSNTNNPAFGGIRIIASSNSSIKNCSVFHTLYGIYRMATWYSSDSDNYVTSLICPLVMGNDMNAFSVINGYYTCSNKVLDDMYNEENMLICDKTFKYKKCIFAIYARGIFQNVITEHANIARVYRQCTITDISGWIEAVTQAYEMYATSAILINVYSEVQKYINMHDSNYVRTIGQSVSSLLGSINADAYSYNNKLIYTPRLSSAPRGSGSRYNDLSEVELYETATRKHYWWTGEYWGDSNGNGIQTKYDGSFNDIPYDHKTKNGSVYINTDNNTNIPIFQFKQGNLPYLTISPTNWGKNPFTEDININITLFGEQIVTNKKLSYSKDYTVSDYFEQVMSMIHIARKFVSGNRIIIHARWKEGDKVDYVKDIDFKITNAKTGENIHALFISWYYFKPVKPNFVDALGFNANLAHRGTTEQRPKPNASDEGFEFYDSTLKKKILWNGTKWVNIDGTEL